MSIASASTTVKFQEFPCGAVVHNYQPGTQVDGPIRSISWCKDGYWIALVPHSGQAEIVSVKDRLKVIHTVEGIEEPSCACFQNTTKKNIAIGTKGGQVLIYDIKSKNVKKRYPRATSAITRVEFTAKDTHVVAACESGEAFIYSNVTNTLSGTFKIPRSQSISALRTNPIKRNYVVAGSNEGVVAVWDLFGNKNKFFIGSHKGPVTAVAFSPISSDLVVSTGLDRQFCFYDIEAHKCIGSIFVENSMTAVDFSPDGKFVIMASQKGQIYVYDTKNIQQPVHSFVGHNKYINHLAFRKSEDYEPSFTMSSENVQESLSVSEPPRNNQSFVLSVTSYEKTKSDISIASEQADSFMQAVGLDQNNSLDSNKDDFSFKGLEGSRKFSTYKMTPSNPNKILQEKFHGGSKSHLTSTPNLVSDETCSPILPFIKQPPSEPCHSQSQQIDVRGLQDVVRKIVKEELKGVAEDIKNEIKYYSVHNLTQTRQMSLDVLMSVVKEFIKIEGNFQDLRTDLAAEFPQNQSPLAEENLMLKQRIARLEEELFNLKRNEVGKDTN